MIKLIISLLLLAIPIQAFALLGEDNFEYLGAFTIPTNTQYSGAAIGYNPVNGSLFIGGNYINGGYLAEVSIPGSFYTGDASDFSATTGLRQPSMIGSFVQNSGTTYYFDISEGNYDNIGVGGTSSVGCNNGWGIGGLSIYSDKILATSYCYYMEPNSVFPLYTKSSQTLSTTGQHGGNYGLDLSDKISGNAGDFHSGAVTQIPLEYQSILGGNVLAGSNSTGMSIVSRTSYGPSLVSFTLGDLTVDNTLSTGVPLAIFPWNHMTLGAWNGSSGANEYVSIADHYGAIIIPPGENTVLIVGIHGEASPGLECTGLATSGTNCYGVATGACSEVCGSAGTPSCASVVSACPDGQHPCGVEGCIPDSENCCYSPSPSPIYGHSNRAWPIRPYVWAYDIGDESGTNTVGNITQSISTLHPTKNNLSAVKLGLLEPWEIKPYITFSLGGKSSYANNGRIGYASGTYDVSTGVAYFSVINAYNGNYPVIEAYQIGVGSPPSGGAGFGAGAGRLSTGTGRLSW